MAATAPRPDTSVANAAGIDQGVGAVKPVAQVDSADALAPETVAPPDTTVPEVVAPDTQVADTVPAETVAETVTPIDTVTPETVAQAPEAVTPEAVTSAVQVSSNPDGALSSPTASRSGAPRSSFAFPPIGSR